MFYIYGQQTARYIVISRYLVLSWYRDTPWPRRYRYRHVRYRDTYRGIAGIAQH